MRTNEVNELISDLEWRLLGLKRIRSGFSRIHSEEYQDGIHKQIAILEQVVMRLKWIMREDGENE